MRTIYLLSFILLASVQLADASFPVANHPPVATIEKKSNCSVQAINEPSNLKVEMQTPAMGIISAIAAILSAVFIFIPGSISVLFIPLAVVALIFGLSGLNDQGRQPAIFGIVLGSIELIVALIAFLAASVSIGML